MNNYFDYTVNQKVNITDGSFLRKIKTVRVCIFSPDKIDYFTLNLGVSPSFMLLYSNLAI